jgi:chorismate mutase/prephenate dehydratase
MRIILGSAVTKENDIKDLRARIDDLDERIVELLKERVGLSRQIGEKKERLGIGVVDPTREQEVYDRLLAVWGPDIPADYLVSIYREVIGVSRAVQHPPRVAYLGPRASFAYEAALERFSRHGEFLASATIDDVFASVLRREADFGVVPVENSTEGIVSVTLDQFIETPLKITGEVMLRITFDLMNKSGKIEDIQKVLSHPQGLAQTRRWLSHNLPRAEQVAAKSTSEAALIASTDNEVAAVAGAEAGKLYDLCAVRHDIGDKIDNYTRFLIIADHHPGPTGNDKTSLLFSVKDRPGILYRVLRPFAKRGISLTKIESRPSRRELWDYVFFLDLVGHIDDPKVKAAVNQIEKHTTSIRLLGSYPRAEARRER